MAAGCLAADKSPVLYSRLQNDRAAAAESGFGFPYAAGVLNPDSRLRRERAQCRSERAIHLRKAIPPLRKAQATVLPGTLRSLFYAALIVTVSASRVR